MKSLPVPPLYSVSFLMKSELELQQSKREILVQKHEKYPHEYFTSCVILVLVQVSPEDFLLFLSL